MDKNLYFLKITPAEAARRGFEVQLTDWCDPDEFMPTQYGVIRVGDWLVREAERISSDPARKAMILPKPVNGRESSHRFQALFVNRPRGLC